MLVALIFSSEINLRSINSNTQAMLMGKKASTILVVEDDEAMRFTLTSYLEKAGYTIYQAESVEAAELILNNIKIDLVLTDIHLPGDDGLVLTRRLRAKSRMGIILVSELSEEVERIIGLEMGADAYIVKPLNMREVLAYVKNLLTRVHWCTEASTASADESNMVYSFGNWQFNTNDREILSLLNQESKRLTRDEFYLLTTFLKNPNKIFSRDEIIDSIHNVDWVAGDRTVDILIARLRKKIDDNNADLIVTVYGQGYVFKSDVRSEIE